jgi:hypothetical protein
VIEKGVVMPCCKECRAWVPDEKGKSGQCRRKAPTKVYSGTEYVGVGLKMKSYEGWPETAADEWCLEFVEQAT